MRQVFGDSHLVLVPLVLFACQSPPADSAGYGAGGSAGGGESGAGGAACAEGPGYGAEVDPQELLSVSADFVDVEGKPRAGVEVTVCGRDICSRLKFTDAEGRVTFEAGDTLPATEELPTLKYASGLTHVALASRLPPGPTHEYTDVPVIAFPELGEGEKLVPGQSASSNGVRVTLAKGAVVKFNPLLFDTADERRFRAVELARTLEIPAVTQEPTLELAFGLTPQATELCPPAALSVPNALAWEPGTEVEFLIHGLTTSEEWAPWGGWAVVSEGRVGASGESIDTDAGAGIPVLSAVGVRRID